MRWNFFFGFAFVVPKTLIADCLLLTADPGIILFFSVLAKRK